ncbi:23S rRNA (uracil(747)-C(5))-methyltransferase RlmC [Cellulomonas cellasea]|uniref:23S rRNA methyltransferase n=2 Tax=Cellulomonas cellasea TaxID=43670 RepID=A0A0A0BCJ0_9CELL|nr:23S rRNA (uracil(747)-C(5))-methyltransferase RlmC [Cellulomonas cellasea]KGM03817.1 23S rRNA methyltransferase [Cellulomonas cellasea DSM 20118]GEA88544.1 23S rRNA (uracil(747)-C(5))-methyltransferase [Cellulomonas cellasea]
MHCSYFVAERCRSCTLLDQTYPEQLAAKQAHAQAVLGPRPDLDWLPPVASVEAGFRNKAKMVAGGTVDAPTLGILDPEGAGVDLRDCPLYPPALHASLPVLADFVTLARLTPYDVAWRTGELKYVLVTQSPDDELLIRFVLRSQESVARIRKHLPALLAALPHAVVVSVNLHPEHKATVEGEREILLTDAETLRMRVNGLDLHLRPQSFFQTNTEVAAALYRQARDWVDERSPGDVWDLYCGVGGFALHVAAPGRTVTGIETSVEAVASARVSAREAGLDGTRFLAGDATAFALGSGGSEGRDGAPDVVIVNPPRRGVGPDLARWLERSPVRSVVYSSCHAGSLARDLAEMPSLVPVRGRVLDMFPQTMHYEVVTLLERR